MRDVRLWAKSSTRIMRLTKDTAQIFNPIAVNLSVEGDKMILTRGNDYALTVDRDGGAHFYVPVEIRGKIPTNERMRIEATKDKVVIYLKEAV